MKQKISATEIFVTALVFIIACFGIGVAIYNRVDKGEGCLTTDNYTKYMEVDCSLGGGHGFGDGVMYYDYFVTIKAQPYYKLINVTLSYSLENNGLFVNSGSMTKTVEAGKTGSIKVENSLKIYGGLESLHNLNLKVKVISITGTYKYTL